MECGTDADKEALATRLRSDPTVDDRALTDSGDHPENPISKGQWPRAGAAVVDDTVYAQSDSGGVDTTEGVVLPEYVFNYVTRVVVATTDATDGRVVGAVLYEMVDRERARHVEQYKGESGNYGIDIAAALIRDHDFRFRPALYPPPLPGAPPFPAARESLEQLPGESSTYL